MGSFDYVRHEADCYNCGHKLTKWQSKSSKCSFEILEPWQVTSMYDICPECGSWNQYIVEAEIEVIVKHLEITLDKTACHLRNDFK